MGVAYLVVSCQLLEEIGSIDLSIPVEITGGRTTNNEQLVEIRKLLGFPKELSYFIYSDTSISLRIGV